MTGFSRLSDQEDTGDGCANNAVSVTDGPRVADPTRELPRTSEARSKRLVRVSTRIAIACLLILAIVGLSFAVFGTSAQKEDGSSVSEEDDRSTLLPLVVENGAVASDSAECSAMGSQILQKGGNAMDAAVTTALCLGLHQPFASGIGGGGYLMYHPADAYSLSTQGREDLRENSVDPKESVVYDFREVAPGACTPTMYIDEDPVTRTVPSSVEGGKAISVPGELAGLYLAHSEHGRLPWYDLVEPVASLAVNGYRVNKLLAIRLRQAREKIMRHPLLANTYWNNVTNDFVEEGYLHRRVEYGETLFKIARHGASVLYDAGAPESVANTLVEDITGSDHAILTVDDLKEYSVVKRKPLRVWYRGLEVLNTPPSSSGGAAIALALNILERYSMSDLYGFLSKEDANFNSKNVRLGKTPSDDDFGMSEHVMVEAFKHAFAHRMLLGDPAFVNLNLTLEAAQSKEVAAWTRSVGVHLNQTLLDPETYLDVRDLVLQYLKLEDESKQQTAADAGGVQMPPTLDGLQVGSAEFDELSRALRFERQSRQRGGYVTSNAGTSHFSIVDKDRNAVAMTTTVNHSFGSKVVSARTGVVLNNQQDDFSTKNESNAFGLRPSIANWVAPKKRPLSSMSPTIALKDGKPYIVVGASGGPTIITAVVQTLLLIVDRGYNAKEAVESRRLHHQLFPNMVTVEKWFPNKLQWELANHKHVVSDTGAMLADGQLSGNVQCIIVREDGKLEAASDSRKLGKPAGF
eukprot:ANDGO_05672.mRNA.1 Gamma-glutamyltranspeptidase 3